MSFIAIEMHPYIKMRPSGKIAGLERFTAPFWLVYGERWLILGLGSIIMMDCGASGRQSKIICGLLLF